jgi:hypothetical protein
MIRGSRWSFVALALLASLGFGCASPVENVWVDPSAAGKPLGFRKVATIAAFREAGLRRTAEDAMASEIGKEGGRVQAIASYTVIGESELGDAKAVAARLAGEGFDGIAVMRVVDRQQRITSYDTMANGGMAGWGYYGRGWGVAYSAPVIETDTIVYIQTNIHRLPEGKLVWSGTSHSTNPRNVSNLVRDVVRDVGHELRKEGLVPED